MRLADVGVLHGAKAPCSGAGHVAHALITAQMSDGGTRMVMIGPRKRRSWPATLNHGRSTLQLTFRIGGGCSSWIAISVWWAAPTTKLTSAV